MPGSVTCPSLFWHDGKTWTSADGRKFLGNLVTADTGTGAAGTPRGGVMTGLATSLQAAAGAGMTVLVDAGYCVIPHPTAGQGSYLTGLMAQATLTVAASDPTNPRIDIVVARISDLGNSSSSSDVEVITGTPAGSPSPPATPSACLLLAQVLVPAGSTSVTGGNITDKRVWTAPPGGIIPIANPAAAPAAPPTQFFIDQSTGNLVRGSGTAGHVLGVTFLAPGVLSVVNTSTGATGLNPGTNYGAYTAHWGIGYGQVGNFLLNTDGSVRAEISLTFTADGVSDYELAYKWQLAVPADQTHSGTAVTAGQITYQLSLDGAVVDTVSHFLSDSGTKNPSKGGTASWYSSAALGTRPGRGAHTATLSVVTAGTHVTNASGAVVGDMHDSAVSLFGVPSAWATALTQENCYVAVIPVPTT